MELFTYAISALGLFVAGVALTVSKIRADASRRRASRYTSDEPKFPWGDLVMGTGLSLFFALIIGFILAFIWPVTWFAIVVGALWFKFPKIGQTVRKWRDAFTNKVMGIK